MLSWRFQDGQMQRWKYVYNLSLFSFIIFAPKYIKDKNLQSKTMFDRQWWLSDILYDQSNNEKNIKIGSL